MDDLILSRLDFGKSTANVRNNDAACNIRSLSAVTALGRVDAYAVILPISALRSSGNRWLTAARHMASSRQAERK